MNNYKKIIYLILLIPMSLLLFACSSRPTKDGPPSFYVNEARISNAVPRVEPLSKYGNMPSYVVFGQRYYVMRSRQYYDQIGIASWYGTKFHKRRTSSGEPYNLLSMTAAHKTLPLPSYVEVTNLANHRKIIVKVNDRGPFAPNRIIDLSYVAAKKLRMLGKGTAVVRVRAIEPRRYGRFHFYAKKATRSYHSQATARFKQTLYLQVGAFRDRANAVRMKKHIAALISTPVKITSGQPFSDLYRVQIGPFRDGSVAARITAQLHRAGIKTNKIDGV